MGKVKQGKRLGLNRDNAAGYSTGVAAPGDPMGAKLPLADEIESLKLAKTKTVDPNKAAQLNPLRKRQADDEEFVDEKMTAKILSQARKQQSELQDEYGIGDDFGDEEQAATKPAVKAGAKTTSFFLTEEDKKKTTAKSGDQEEPDFRPFKKLQTSRLQQQKIRKSDHDDSDSDSDTDEQLGDYENKRDFYSDEELKINEEDQKAFDMFMSDKPIARKTVADIILEKLTEKKTEIATQMNDDDRTVNGADVQLDERIVRMYSQIKEILRKYRSGKLPKAFKILPSLNNWEHILFITEPDNWSAAAVYQATRIFASNLNQKMAQRFYNLVLLPRIRDDINEYKRLNFHLYMALKKALFKPAAFFKGILLPMSEESNCTLREAIIMGSVLAKNSIPMLHSAAALLKLAEMKYSGANSIFIRILLDKKYALPYRVIDAIVHHFVQFQNDKRQLPVLWHQALLTFVQRYKSDIASEQKEALLELLKAHTHHEITNEVRRELVNSKSRDLENEDENSQHSMDLNFSELN